MKVRVVEPPEELRETIPRVAVLLARWMSEPRVIIVYSGPKGGRILIAPPIPHPLCTLVRNPLDEAIAKHVLKELGLPYYSACLVSRSLYSASLSETIRNIVEETGLILEEG